MFLSTRAHARRVRIIAVLTARLLIQVNGGAHCSVHHRHTHQSIYITHLNRKQHWETVYGTTSPDSVSWYRAHLDTSLSFIERATPDRGSAILDVGGGTSTLVDDLLARGYHDVSVLDISAAAVQIAQRRLGASATRAVWIVSDLLTASLLPQRYDLWHDRAVFHFLTEADERLRYVRQLTHALKPDGYAVIATFGPRGPTKCSGLDTMRYDAQGLANVLGDSFELADSLLELHPTPSGAGQQFLYTLFQRTRVGSKA